MRAVYGRPSLLAQQQAEPTRKAELVDVLKVRLLVLLCPQIEYAATP